MLVILICIKMLRWSLSHSSIFATFCTTITTLIRAAVTWLIYTVNGSVKLSSLNPFFSLHCLCSLGCYTTSEGITTWKRLCTMRTWGALSSRRCLTSSAVSLWWPIMRILLFQSFSRRWSRYFLIRNFFYELRYWIVFLYAVLHSLYEPNVVYTIKLFCTYQTWLKSINLL